MRWRTRPRALPGAARPSNAPTGLARAVPRPILVGVDGSAASTRALEWATVRAIAGHTSLHIVHAVPTQVWWPNPHGLILFWEAEPREWAERVLAEAAGLARDQAPLLEVTTRLWATDPAAALVEEGLAAELIVLGRRRWGRAGWPHASVAARVARRARGRVVLVGPDNEVLV